MKQLCMVNYVWGSYQMYIPIYLLFLGINYPNYDARIYVDQKISENVEKQLEIVKRIYSNFSIVEEYLGDYNFTSIEKKNTQIMRSQRWLNYEPEYANYKALYFGDIDILICKEKSSIFDSHEIHCKTINRVYSNAARPAISVPSIKCMELLSYVRKYGIWQTIDLIFDRRKESLRYSGLHYVQTKPYFDAVLPYREYFYRQLRKMANKKKSIFNAYYFNNEELLRILMEKAGVGNCYAVDASEDPLEKGYRPDHGLHLGRYRGEYPVKENEGFLERHKVFYEQYECIKQTKEYIDIEKLFPEELIRILKNMEASFR